MLPVGEVLPGVVVFLECGCLRRRGISPPDAAVLVIVERLRQPKLAHVLPTEENSGGHEPS